MTICKYEPTCVDCKQVFHGHFSLLYLPGSIHTASAPTLTTQKLRLPIFIIHPNKSQTCVHNLMLIQQLHQTQANAMTYIAYYQCTYKGEALKAISHMAYIMYYCDRSGACLSRRKHVVKLNLKSHIDLSMPWHPRGQLAISTQQ